jgi:hypothetical protein
LRAVAVVVEKPGGEKVAIVACDVLWVTRAIVDAAAGEIERTTGIPASHVLINATHTHHAPGTAPAHAFGWSKKFADDLARSIARSVQEANGRLAEASFFFKLGQEDTVGGNSRLRLRDGNISWLNPMGEAGDRVDPTGPFDPQLPVLDFRSADGRTLGLIYNHSTHTIGTRTGLDVRSSGFYGLAAQELEREIGGVVSFLEGASGSTHNVRGVTVPVAIERLKRAVLSARAGAERRPVGRVTAIKRPFTYRVRTFDEAVEAAKVDRYATNYARGTAPRIAEIFATARRELRSHQGEERTTWVQAVVIGDVAIVGVPAEYFTASEHLRGRACERLDRLPPGSRGASAGRVSDLDRPAQLRRAGDGRARGGRGGGDAEGTGGDGGIRTLRVRGGGAGAAAGGVQKETRPLRASF